MTARISPLWLLIDAAGVVVFAAIGRASHERGLGPYGVGVLETAWPFLVALAVGWAVAFAWRNPTAPVRTGLPVWAVTVAGGIGLRALSGQGVAPAFVIVATLTLLLVLVGWRLVRRLATRPRG